MRPSRHRPRPTTASRIGYGVACAVAGLSIAAGQNLLPRGHDDLPGEPEPTGFLAGSLLPDGGILKNVLIPQYDRDLSLASTFRAEELIIVTRKTIDANRLRIDFFNPDRTPRGHIVMAQARYDADQEMLTTREPVSLVSNDLTADGSALVYDVKNSRGFLHGPVTAVTSADTRTSMNTRPARHALAAGALLMASTLGLPAQDAAPTSAEKIAAARLSPQRIGQLDADARSRRPDATAAAETGARHLAEARDQGEKADNTMAGFFRAAALTSLLAEPIATPPADEVPRPDVKQDAAKTRITSDDGAFFDSQNGLLIFLKNVMVKDPRFQLSGADEVKVFFEPKKPAKAPAAKPGGKPGAAKPAPIKKDDDALGSASFGKPSRMVATGTVVVDYRSEDPAEPPLKASARMLVYDLIKKEIILRGGSPWVLRDGQLSSVPGNDAYIVIQQNGSFVTGNGGIDASVDTQTRKEAKKKP